MAEHKHRSAGQDTEAGRDIKKRLDREEGIVPPPIPITAPQTDKPPRRCFVPVLLPIMASVGSAVIGSRHAGIVAASAGAMDRTVLARVLTGLSDRNVRFSELRNLVLSLRFDERIKGDHHIFSRAGVAEILNLQPLKGGLAKAYQVRQVRSVVLRYKLHEEVRDA